MAIVRLLVVSKLIDDRTKEVIHTSVGVIHRPNGKAFKRTFKDNPVKGYSLKVKVYDTFVQKRLQEYAEQGAQLLNL